MRINTSIGDVFEVPISDRDIRYIQLIAIDSTQLDSDVIRAFEKIYQRDKPPTIRDLVREKVDFYAHCVTKWGVKMGIWNRIGNSLEIGGTENILFRDTPDYGQNVSVSHNWWLWNINKPQESVGILKGSNQMAEIGLVFSPIRIMNRLKTGEYGINYPHFE